MFTAILLAAPRWVWFLLVALIGLGVLQSFPRAMTLRRATIVPLALVAYSLFGVASAFAGQAEAIAGWALGLGAVTLTAVAVGAWPGMVWSQADQHLRVPGSWWPMVVILGIFVAKFAVGVMLAMEPSLRYDVRFASVVGLAYGCLSGVFFSRAVAMWRTAHRALAVLA